MPRTTSITLTPHFEKFVADQVATGRFSSTSEIIREALRLMEIREEKVAALRAAVDAGIAELDQGKGLNYSSEQLKDELLK
ncbi:MAG: type II toxin-antitoxin system ParD family antitoxin [Salinisphaera sp.]|jgi:antitoxin ParD1/3/4|nr:type II toxin-antitoxin system ParD family antitoxin [Salinisphaera sp.]